MKALNKKTFLLGVCLLLLGQICFAQKNETINNDSITSNSIIFSTFRQPYRQWQLTGGYQYNAEKDKKSNHILELGVAKVIDAGGMEPVGCTYYFSNEFLFNSKKFLTGPKIGGNIYFWGVALGSEIVYYTDFQDNTLHWVPFFGFGIGAGKLFLAGHIPFYNKQFPVNAFSVGLTMPLCKLSKKKIKI